MRCRSNLRIDPPCWRCRLGTTESRPAGRDGRRAVRGHWAGSILSPPLHFHRVPGCAEPVRRRTLRLRLKRHNNGQQNAYRRDPSGRDPGGRVARQPGRRIRLRVRKPPPTSRQHLSRQGDARRAVAAGGLRRLWRQPPRLPGFQRNPSRLLPNPGRRPAGSDRRGRARSPRRRSRSRPARRDAAAFAPSRRRPQRRDDRQRAGRRRRRETTRGESKPAPKPRRKDAGRCRAADGGRPTDTETGTTRTRRQEHEDRAHAHEHQARASHEHASHVGNGDEAPPAQSRESGEPDAPDREAGGTVRRRPGTAIPRERPRTSTPPMLANRNRAKTAVPIAMTVAKTAKARKRKSSNPSAAPMRWKRFRTARRATGASTRSRR